MAPAVARRHFQALLEAKQARVRQGPSYPPANAFTGQHETTTVPPPSTSAEAAPSTPPEPPQAPSSAPEPHGRGNQGMRHQK